MRAAVFFATREGQTRKIAERIAGDLRAHDVEVDLQDDRTLRAPIDLNNATLARDFESGARESLRYLGMPVWLVHALMALQRAMQAWRRILWRIRQ